LEERGGDEALPVIAPHYAQSAERVKALEYLVRAADRAASVFAVREAAHWYAEAADLTDAPGPRADLIRQAALLTYSTGEIDGAISLVRQAMTLYDAAGQTVKALDARRLLGRYLWLAGQGEAAERETDAAIAGLESAGPTPELALAYAYKGQIRMLAADYREGAAWSRKAIDLAESQGAIEALVHATNTLGTSLADSADLGGLEHLRRSLALALEHGLVDDAGRAYVNMSGQGMQVMFGRPEEAEALFQEGLAFAARTIPGGTYDLWIRTGWAEFLSLTARWDEAERVLDSLDRDIRSNRYLELAIRAYRALIHSHRGLFDRAHELMDGSAEPALRVGDLQATLPVFAAIAHAEAGRGNADGVAGALRQAVEGRGDSYETPISSWFLFEAADAAAMIARSGDNDGLGKVLAAVEPLSVRLDALVDRSATHPMAEVRNALSGAALWQLRRLGTRPGAPVERAGVGDGLPDPNAAAGILEANRRVFDAARVRLWLAESGDTAGIRGAVATFERLGAVPYLAAASEGVKPPR
jgi:tetratricopeptide (TPR) repeat protein